MRGVESQSRDVNLVLTPTFMLTLGVHSHKRVGAGSAVASQSVQTNQGSKIISAVTRSMAFQNATQDTQTGCMLSVSREGMDRGNV